jgi:CubicO group peptidase (beta-lactamase class C family)
MQYGVSTDVLGFLIERIEGKSLQASLKDRIFTRLGMKDTDFYVPSSKMDRLASLYEFDEAKVALKKAHDFITPKIDQVPSVFFGASGLISTADDYMAFAQMLQNGGHSGYVRLLNPETVRLMRANLLTDDQREYPFIGQTQFWDGMGFGLGVAVVQDRVESNILNGSVGSYGWPGLWGPWWENDPLEDLTLIYLIQQAVPITPNSGDAIGGGRGIAFREALPTFERMVYEAVGSPLPFAK